MAKGKSRKPKPEAEQSEAPKRPMPTAAELASRTMLSAEEAAMLAGISRRHLYRLWYLGKGPPITKIGKLRLVRREALEKWCEEQEAATMAAIAAGKKLWKPISRKSAA